jgi:predicted nuclease of predicted toxin-antitoxin system
VKVKLDENITAAAKALIAEHGHEVDTIVDERLTGAADSVVIEACRSDERMLVTFDVGFGDVRVYQPGSHNGIVLLRARLRCEATQRLAGGRGLVTGFVECALQ